MNELYQLFVQDMKNCGDSDRDYVSDLERCEYLLRDFNNWLINTGHLKREK